MERLRVLLCVLLLAPLAAVAQDEPAVEDAPAEDAAVDEAAAAEEVSEAEVAGEASAPLTGHFFEAYSLLTSAYTVKPAGALGSTERGTGAGARALFRVFAPLAVTAEYATRTFDDTDTDLTETRFGIGATAGNDNGDLAGLFLEYDKLDFETTELDGYSVRARLVRQPQTGFNTIGDIGYVFLQDDVEDLEGIELNVGIGFSWRFIGAFAGWHFLDLEGQDSATRAQLNEARAGVRLSF